MMKGTPYVYQGEELGMTNVNFEDIADYRDIETLQAYEEMKSQGWNERMIMKSIHAKSRDNARTPMQWSAEKNAGFTTGTPWVKVNPNYQKINAQNELSNPDSVFYYYQKLIHLRKQNEIIVYGNYQLILENHPEIYAYVRTFQDKKLLVICNFYGNSPVFELPRNIHFMTKQLLASNYETEEQSDISRFTLQPYEARVYLLN
jgi:oligo-1,6-glucosidase